jgi:hypothetical protein
MRSLRITSILLLIGLHTIAQTKSDQEMAGLKGTVKTVVPETTWVSQPGRPFHGSVQRAAKYILAFDKEGRKTGELWLDSTGNPSRRTTQEYAPDGREVETTYKADGSVAEKLTVKHKRDTEGRITESSFAHSDGSVRSRSVRSYDSQGRFIGGATYNGDGSLSNTSVTVYDINDKVRDFTLYNPTGGVIQKQIRSGEFLELTLFNDRDGSTIMSERRRDPIQEAVDSHGNWTRRKTLMTVTELNYSDETVVVENRTITYY